jgi:hypothetical protein
MMRRLLPILAVLLVAGGAAACDASLTPFAAKVNGATIPQSRVTGELDAITADAPLRCIIESNTPIAGAGKTGTYATAFEASRLTSWIDTQIINTELARRNVPVTAFALNFARTQLASEFSPPQGSACTTSGADVVASFGPMLQTSIIGGQASSDALAAVLGGHQLTASGVATFIEQHPVAASSQCISDIATKTMAEANTARAAIENGAEFSVVAKASSVDTATAPSGGAAGCFDASELSTSLVSLLGGLRIDQLSPVTEVNGDFLILEVTARHRSVAAATQALVALGNTALQKVVSALTNAADVDINPSFGRWAKVSGTFQVTTNAGPATGLLGNESAISPSVTP